MLIGCLWSTVAPVHWGTAGLSSKSSNDKTQACTLTRHYTARGTWPYMKPLCRISASCWMQVGCRTYLLQPRCACNPSLSPLPPSCFRGSQEHSPQVCVCLFICMHASMLCVYLFLVWTILSVPFSCTFLCACISIRVCLLYHYSSVCLSILLLFFLRASRLYNINRSH